MRHRSARNWLSASILLPPAHWSTLLRITFIGTFRATDIEDVEDLRPDQLGGVARFSQVWRVAGVQRFGMARRRCESNGERDTCRNQVFRYMVGCQVQRMKERVYSLKTAGQKFIISHITSTYRYIMYFFRTFKKSTAPYKVWVSGT